MPVMVPSAAGHGRRTQRLPSEFFDDTGEWDRRWRREISCGDTVYNQDLARYWMSTRSEVLAATSGW